MAERADFQEIFKCLRGILSPFAGQLVVQADTDEDYSLYTTYLPEWKKAVSFGAVQIKKNYVSFHLIPVYTCPALREGMSADLKKRMQGKSCFNFTRVDQGLFDELRQVTARGFEAFQRQFKL